MSVGTGRFDDSFAIRMIRDFMIALTIIIVVELGGRLLYARYEFQHEDKRATELAAERLASDIRDIMLNQGGPTAARTLYPIIKRNHRDRGLDIAIEPSDATIESIGQRFSFEPEGLPPAWAEDKNYHESKIEIRAEFFCTTCHFTAKPGDVLGTVTVRNYRSVRMGEWWREARVVSVVGMANVIAHTIVLFFLLRVRMEPLLQLRATVARLAKGRLDLSQRTVAKSSDEFGELAQDLNHFLDRVSHLVHDLNDVLGKVGAVNERLTKVSSQMEQQMESVHTKVRIAARQAVELNEQFEGPSEQTIRSLDLILSAINNMVDVRPMPTEVRDRLADTLAAFRNSAVTAQASSLRFKELGISLTDLRDELKDDSHYLGEIMVLEERMKIVADSGKSLLAKLSTDTPVG